MEKENQDFYKIDKTNFIEKKIERERNLNWYIKNYRKNLNLSLFLSIIIFLFTVCSLNQIKIKNENRDILITSTSGKVVQYNMTEEKKILLRKALTKLSQNKGNEDARKK